MRLHTNLLTSRQLYTALSDARTAGTIALSVYFEVLEDKGSRSRDHAFEIQLGCTGKVAGDKRGWKNSGQDGAADVYAATYAEWGYFIAALFAIDAEATFGPYMGEEDFHAQTGFQFAATVPQPDPYPYVLKGSDRRPTRAATPSLYGTWTHAPRVAVTA